jgi:hypothetical protein
LPKTNRGLGGSFACAGRGSAGGGGFFREENGELTGLVVAVVAVVAVAAPVLPRANGGLLVVSSASISSNPESEDSPVSSYSTQVEEVKSM